jgi:hypothetical protein
MNGHARRSVARHYREMPMFKRISGFLAGLLVGAVCTMTALKYHVVRAEDGFHLVPKLSAQFSEAYVDIRGFDLADWNKHRSLALAVARSGKTHLLQDSTSDAMRRSLDSAMELLRGA